MRLLLFLLIGLLSMIAPAKTMQTVNNAVATTAQSERLKSLDSREASLSKDLIRSQDWEAIWHDLYLWVGVFAVALGAISIVFQRLETRNIRKGRATSDLIAGIHSERAMIEKHISDVAIAEALTVASIANKAAEGEKLERVRLEALVAPRRLSIEQQRNIGDACLGITGRKIVVTSYGLDGEGFALGWQILSALHRPGLNVSGNLAGIVQSGVFDTGVLVRTPPEEEGFGKCICHALHALGGLEVILNGERHVGNAVMLGPATTVGPATMIGGGRIQPKGFLPAGSPIEIMVGIKPINPPLDK